MPAQEGKLRELLARSPIGVSIRRLSTDQRLFVNRPFLKLFGATSVEEMDRVPRVDTYVDAEDYIRMQTMFDATGEIDNFEVQRRRVDGSSVWTLLNARLIEFEGVTACIAWHIDISERKRIEDALKRNTSDLEGAVSVGISKLEENESLLMSIVDNLPVGVLIKDAEHVVVLANSACVNWYGFERETLIGSPSEHVEVFKTPADKDVMLEQEDQVLRTGEMLTRIVERPFADGTTHTIEIKKFPIYDRDGTIGKVGSVTLDLTEQVEARKALARSEERLRDFAEVASDWFWETDADHRFIYFSERNRQVLEFDPSHHLGKRRTEISGEDLRSEKWRSHLDDLEHHRPFRDFCYDMIAASGGRRTLSISGRPLFDEDGVFLGYRGTGTDITERRRAEEARDRALNAAERASQAKSQFLATVSHEFRTPLNAILGFSELMRSKYFGELGHAKYAEYAEDINRSADHLLMLVNDILDISTIVAGKRTFEKSEIDVDRLVSECVGDVVEAARAKNVALDVDVRPGLPALQADRRSMKQIVLNLLSNAIKFTPSGGSVVVTATRAGSGISLSVADTGIGIPDDMLAHVLEPFSRVAVSAEIAHEGTGLGLSIVNSLVTAHGGTLDIASEVGAGTKVTVTIPND